jgi:hypothetical protein
MVCGALLSCRRPTPATPDPDLPPAGRSLFDALVANPPFPFEALLARLQSRLGPYESVLIPLGRSLQRSAAAPNFFRYPRAVAAFGDRLFLGYQEKAGIIEVLSYNEEAGRFEFQLIENYRANATPRISYAPRKICTACHQNQAPLFANQLWDETNANPKIAQFLTAQHRDFYGLPIARQPDDAYRIDQAIHRANEMSVYQKIWRESPPRIRAAWLRAMFQQRLTNSYVTSPELAKFWQTNWPNGLPIPNPEIPNRNPLARISRGGPTADPDKIAALTQAQKTIEPQFEPATLRAPLEIWRSEDRMIAGLAATLPADAIRALDTRLAAQPAPESIREFPCTIDATPNRLQAHCGVEILLYLHNDHITQGAIDAWNLTIATGTPAHFEAITATGLSPRLPDGARIRYLSIENSTLHLATTADFRHLPPAPPACLASPVFRASLCL